MRRLATLVCLGMLSAGIFGYFMPFRGSSLTKEEEITATEAAISAIPDAPEEETDTARDYLSDLRDALPSDVRDAYDEAGGEEVLVGAEYLFSFLLSSLRDQSGEVIGIFFSLLGVVLLGTVAGLLSPEKKSPLRDGIAILTGAVTALAVYRTLSVALSRVGVFLGDLLSFSSLAAPILAGILTAGGSAGAAAVSTASFSGLLILFEQLAVRVLSPLVGLCFAFSLVESISPEIRLGGISKCVRGIYLTVIGAASAVSAAALSLQTVLASSADTVALRTAKYAVGNLIPIIGSSVGSSLGTVGASLSLVKSSVGVTGVAAILLLTVPTLVYLFLVRLALSLSGAAARLLGFAAGEKLIGEFREVFNMLLAVTVFASVTFLIFFAVFLKTALPVAP